MEMRINFLTISVFLLIISGSFSACTEKEGVLNEEEDSLFYDIHHNQQQDKDDEIECKEIPFFDYVLLETICLWSNTLHNYTGRVIIINTLEELDQYITCAEGNYPDIDFSTQSLLLASGQYGYPDDVIEKSLRQIAENEYQLDIAFRLFETNIIECWDIAMVTSKLSSESIVKTNISRVKGSIKLKNLDFRNKGDLIIINSKEELENYFDCTENDSIKIDFSTQTMLLAYGITEVGIGNIDKRLSMTAANEYVFKIDISLGHTMSPILWIVRLLVTEIHSNYAVSLNLNKIGFNNFQKEGGVSMGK